MDIVGYVFLGLIALGIVGGLVFTAMSLPDIARYQRIRKM
jgi:uncharacterized protein DUF6893